MIKHCCKFYEFRGVVGEGGIAEPLMCKIRLMSLEFHPCVLCGYFSVSFVFPAFCERSEQRSLDQALNLSSNLIKTAFVQAKPACV